MRRSTDRWRETNCNPMTVMTSPPKTTKFTRPVKAIADIEALEREPYDELVPARNLCQLFEATALLHPDRPS